MFLPRQQRQTSPWQLALWHRSKPPCWRMPWRIRILLPMWCNSRRACRRNWTAAASSPPGKPRWCGICRYAPTSPSAKNGKARQHFGEAVPLAWQREDWTGLPDEDLGAAIDAYCLQERRRGFDLAKPPLMRFSLLQTATGQHFVWTYHHILIDGWSMPVLLSEVMAAYGKQLTAVPAPDFRVFLFGWNVRMRQRRATSGAPNWPR